MMWLLLRRASQMMVLTLFLLGPWFGIWIIKGNLSASLLLETVPLTDPLLVVQLLATVGEVTGAAWTGFWIVVLLYVVVGGRAFCSWVCPVNPVTDLANWLRRRWHLTRFTTLPGTFRFWVLGAVVVVSAVTGGMAWELVNPVSILHRELIFGMGWGWMVILGIFLLDLLFSDRGWCGHICPMGALYSLIGRLSLVRIQSDKDRCDHCNQCYPICPEPYVITPAIQGNREVILDSQCTNCGRCIDVCPQDVFSFKLHVSSIKERFV